MVELLMQNYGITYARAVELMEMPIMEAAAILNSYRDEKNASKTNVKTEDE